MLTNESISKSLKSSIISVSYYFLQISFTLIPPNILLNTFLSKEVSRFAIPFSMSKILHCALPLVLLMYYRFLLFLLWVLTESLVQEVVNNLLYLHLYFFFQSLVLIHFRMLELYQDVYSLSLFQNYMY